MKAILVIDMPRCCAECRAFDYEYLTCLAKTDGSFDEKWNVQRQGWCPLKPMPEKKDGTFRWTGYSDVADESFLHGWNDCIEEIER